MDPRELAPVPVQVDEDAVDDEVRRYVTGAITPAPRPPWRIENAGQADWCMRRLNDVDRAVQEYSDQITLWSDAKARLARARTWYEARLQDWALANRTDAVKTFPLPHGTVSTTRTGEGIMLVDAERAVEWAQQHAPQAVKTEYSLLVSQLGDDAVIVDMVEAWRGVNAEGEIHVLELVDAVEWTEKRQADAAQLLADTLGDGPWQVTVERSHRAVVDRDGVPVPGLAVRPAKVTAKVRGAGL